MRVHYLQHVPFESPERIADWVRDKGHTLSGTSLYESTHFPLQSEFDLLIVLGGPMGVYEEKRFPWLVQEKAFINETIRQQKLVLGICLGAQLIAEALGGKVYRNAYKEIGWHSVKMTKKSQDTVFFKHFPHEYIPFHWHGDTFELPDEVKTAAISLGCANQAFEYNGHVVGLQFHLESSNDSIKNLIEYCSDEIEPGRYIQHPDQ
ncbi:type 1 glutamine amidotransferase [Litoribacterium kuwaitense]|uniref:type 1 glutamine amidotransferase n=1 Tax=Litoribacterium kuwaitense TaxID=1398745 RepID=UPI001FE8CA8B|nr:type 1 glutamine amidotransferase [Litoribacterium kuwaitense]